MRQISAHSNDKLQISAHKMIKNKCAKNDKKYVLLRSDLCVVVTLQTAALVPAPRRRIRFLPRPPRLLPKQTQEERLRYAAAAVAHGSESGVLPRPRSSHGQRPRNRLMSSANLMPHTKTPRHQGTKTPRHQVTSHSVGLPSHFHIHLAYVAIGKETEADSTEIV